MKRLAGWIDKHGLIAWRFHDHWHRRRPDGIYEGMVKELEWNEFRRPDNPALFTVPETTVAALAKQLESRFDHAAIRVVGNPGMRCAKLALSPGAPSSMTHIKLLRRDDVEVLVAGESPEWETVEYVRDAAAEGKGKAVIFLGHVNSEEAGMDECAKWLKGFVSEVPVQFVPAGDPFWTTR
jgi:putative NIF3 family GTP cyclohydrolase 1 type 2